MKVAKSKNHKSCWGFFTLLDFYIMRVLQLFSIFASLETFYYKPLWQNVYEIVFWQYINNV